MAALPQNIHLRQLFEEGRKHGNSQQLHAAIEQLYDKDPHIHVTIHLSHPRREGEDIPATIRGVYPNIFRIEECKDGYVRSHSVQYTELLTGQVVIRELGDVIG